MSSELVEQVSAVVSGALVARVDQLGTALGRARARGDRLTPSATRSRSSSSASSASQTCSPRPSRGSPRSRATPSPPGNADELREAVRYVRELARRCQRQTLTPALPQRVHRASRRLVDADLAAAATEARR